jgi:hypothetical protein
VPKIDRKEAIRAFKERKPSAGIYALRCAASGQVWVGASPNLEAMRNRIEFQFQQGMHREPSLSAAVVRHGADAFRFEILETFDEELAPLLLPDAMRERRAHWIAELHAERLL